MKITKMPPDSGPFGVGDLQQATPTKGLLPTKSVTPPPAPPSMQPLELFPRESTTGGRGRAAGGAGGVPHPSISTDTAKNEVQWHTWRLECQIKKVNTISLSLPTCSFTPHSVTNR